MFDSEQFISISSAKHLMVSSWVHWDPADKGTENVQ